MNSQKSLQSVDSTGIRHQDSDRISQSPQRWRQLESKYLKYIALLKSKADKSKKKLNSSNKCMMMACWIKYKVMGRMMEGFKGIEMMGRRGEGGRVEGREEVGRKRNGKGVDIKSMVEFRDKIQGIVDKNRTSAFLLLAKRSQCQNQCKQLTKKTLNKSPIDSKLSNNPKHLLAIQQLQKLQSTIIRFSSPSSPCPQLFSLKLQNAKLKQQIKAHTKSINHLTKQLQSTQQRMQMQLLKKSLALMQSQVDSQQKQQLIKQYQIQLKCRVNSNNRVLLFSLQDFEVERQRLELVNEKLYKEFESSKQGYVVEIKNLNNILNELKLKFGRTSIDLSESNSQLESLRAYKFENQYQKECQKYKQVLRLNSLQMPTHNSGYLKNPLTLQLLKHIQSLFSRQLPEINILEHLSKSQTLILQSIQQKICSSPNPTTIKNRLIKLNSLQRSIAIEQNVRVSNQDLHSFLEIFEVQNDPPNTSIDTKIQEQLENKVLSLNERLFDVRELVLSLLQSIQIRNPTKDLLSLIEVINDTFEFSECEKQSFHGGRKSLFQKIFS